jgi:hypothetical protein
MLGSSPSPAWLRSPIQIDIHIHIEHLFKHWHINHAPHGKYTCAELVATAFLQVGVRLVPDKDPDEIAPADLARLLPPEALPRA